MRDHVGDIEFVLGGFGAVSGGDIIDQPLVERPGIHSPLPIIDDGVAEAIGLGLHVGDAGGYPGGAGGAEIVLGRLGEEGIDGELQRPRRIDGVRIARLSDIRVNLENVFRRRIGGMRGPKPSSETNAKSGSGEVPCHRRSS